MVPWSRGMISRLQREDHEWSRGMISRLQREDHEFESRRNHSQAFWPSVKNLDQNFFSFFEKIFFYFIFWINFFINFNSIFLQWFRGLGVWYLAYNERITSSNLVGTTSQLFFFILNIFSMNFFKFSPILHCF